MSCRILVCVLTMLSFFFFSDHTSAETNRNSIFLRVSVSNNRPYIGEEILLTYTLYFNGNAPRIEDTANPTLQSVWAREIDPGRHIRSVAVTVDGISYRSAIIRQYKLAPMKRGNILLSNYRVKCFIPDEAGKAGAIVPDKEVMITAPEITLNVRSLPEPAPQSYNGAVGTFTLSLSSDRKTVQEGEPFHLFLAINGKGNLLTLHAPELFLPKGINQKENKITAALDKNSSLSSGSLVTSMTVYADTTGSMMISPVRFVYFDPAKKTYKIISSSPLSVTVLENAIPEKKSSAREAEKREELPLEQQPLSESVPMKLLFIVLLGTGVAIAITLLKTSRKHKRSDTNAVIKSTGVPSSPEELKELVVNTLKQKGIGNPKSLTKKELCKAMKAAALSDEICGELADLLEKLDQELYSPIQQTEQLPLQKKTADLLLKLQKTSQNVPKH
ncbi:MAG: protein BatD [Chlorobiaceae bacterium]|jgi:hypothetical protein|nr:protein BatD [Chlorobiaceae bacterium]